MDDMKLVLDTDVVLSGLRSSHGASRILLVAAWEGVVIPLATVGMMLEYEAVLKRPANLDAMALTTDEVDVFLDQWSTRIRPVDGYFSWRPSIRDPNDELFVDAAMNGAADMIVTFNVKDYVSVDRQRNRLSFSVCRPADVLRSLTWRPSATTLSAFHLR